MLDKTSGLFNGRHFAGKPQSAAAAIAAVGYAIARVLERDSPHYELMERLIHSAKLWWQLNLPGVLASYSSGQISSRPVAIANWQRIITGEPQPVAYQDPQSLALEVAIEEDATPQPQDYIGIYTNLAKDCKKICSTLGKAKNLHKATSHQAGPCCADLKKLSLKTYFGGYLRDWVCECLTLGYDARGNETARQRKPVAPSTLMAATASLRNEVVYDLLRNRERSAADFVKTYQAAIERASSPAAEANRARAYQRFHRWLVRKARYPSLRFEITPDNRLSGGRANVISEAEYHRSLAIASSTKSSDPSHGMMLRIALILGFRCGLRPSEAIYTRVDDFKRVPATFELIVRSNTAQSVKSSNGKRILPLHLLLTENEQAEVLSGLRVRTGKLRHQTSGAMLFEIPEDTRAFRIERTAIYGEVNSILREVTGNPKANFYDLRHSFASYLLATFLLPSGIVEFPYQSVGPDCISQARRQRLHPALLGNSLARSALYAISFLMGHAGPHRALAHYSHLLDWSLDGYVRQTQHFRIARAQPSTSRAALRSASTTTQMVPTELATDTAARAPVPPDWRALSKALSKVVDGGSPTLAAATYGIAPHLLDQLSTRLTAVIAIKTSHDKQRHRLVATDYAKKALFGLPRLDPGSPLVDQVWQNCQAGRLDSPDVMWALETFLHTLDPARCDVPLTTAHDAVRYAKALETLGFHRETIMVRHQYRGGTGRTAWLTLPSSIDDESLWDPDGRVSRFRIAVVSGSGNRAAATNSYRFAMTLAALLSSATIPGTS